jgi:hypothetical protein
VTLPTMTTLFQNMKHHVDIMRTIFEFDGTYRDKFADTVLIAIWRGVWEDYLKRVADPGVFVAMSHLFQVWGVSNINAVVYQPDVEFLRRHYFPDQMCVVDFWEYDGSHRVLVYMRVFNDSVMLFNGRVVTTDMHVAEDYVTRDDPVYSDPDLGLVVYW